MKKYAIVSDFDGTITYKDIGNTLCLHFKSTTQCDIEAAYNMRADARQWMQHHFKRIKVGKDQFEEVVLNNAVLRKGFMEFAHYCTSSNIPIEIASGGLDIYIKPVLHKFKVPTMPLRSVKGQYTDDGIEVSFTDYEGRSLEEFKRARVKHFKDAGYITLYFGDGPGDFEAAQEADIVFADSYLAKLCQKHNIAFRPLDFDVAFKIITGGEQ